MRMVIASYSAGARGEWFYYAETKSVYHVCSVQRKTEHIESEVNVPCPYCHKAVPDFIMLAARLGVSTS